MVGRIVFRCRILEKIGQVGMGEVYRAENISLSREVAIKVLPKFGNGILSITSILFSTIDTVLKTDLPRKIATAALMFVTALISAAILPPAYAEPNTIIDTVLVGDRPLGMAVDRVHNKVYVSNESDHNVMVIDGVTNSVVKTIEVGLFPRGVAVNEAMNKVYVANQSSNTVSQAALIARYP